MNKLGEMYEGWSNHLFPKEGTKEYIEEISNQRLSICRKCEYNSLNKENYITLRKDEHCVKCGCTLIAKTKCMGCECPLSPPKWSSINNKENGENNDT